MRLVAGIGFNDLSGETTYLLNGKRVRTPSYLAWHSLLFRTIRNKNYTQVGVCPDWLTFSKFKKWHDENYVENWELDKDLLIPGNLVYRPNACLYIPSELNNFIACQMVNKGDQPLGVRLRGGRYTSQISTLQGQKHLGTFSTPEQAHTAWYEEKLKMAYSKKDLCDTIHPNLFSGLIENVKLMKEKV